MATLKQLETALVNAHNAGDVDAARKLAAVIAQARKDPVNQIPDTPVSGTVPQAPEPTFVDKLIGGAETDLQLLTGATTGAVGGIVGVVKEFADRAINGHEKVSEAQNMREIEQAYIDGMQKLTYEPRTVAGQQIARKVGSALGAVAPAVPLTGELNALNAAMRPAARAVGNQAAAAASRVEEAVPAMVSQAKSAISKPAATPGTMGSVGASGTDIALQRRQMAEQLPVPIKLTKGQADRSFEQQRFEQEAAKDPNTGAALRDRFAQQNEDILKNFDAFVDATGAEAPNLRATGVAVDKALVAKAARDKAEIRVAYKEAEKAGEMSEPVATDKIISFLNESYSAESVAPVLKAARAELVRLGGATLDEAGNLSPRELTLKSTEDLRRFVNKVTGTDPTNIKYAADIKSVIDGVTEGAGGNIYRKARALRLRYAEQYENRAVIAKLLRTNRGTQDRTVALEDVWNHTILKGSKDDVRVVRKVLQTSGDDGKQAWRELQGATISWMKEEATKGVATDVRGNPIISAAGLNKAIRSLDHDEKLDFIFGKKGAQQLRDINDLAKVVFTSPPGSTNSSNTASVILAALSEAGINGSMTGLPVPVLTSLRVIAMRVKDRRIQKRIEEALNDAKREQQLPAPKKQPRTLH